MSRKYLHYHHHPQLLCTPLEYPALLQAWWYRAITSDGYQAVSPRYLISRCPFCGAEHSAKVDTHSIISWNHSTVGSGKCFGKEQAEVIGCPHFICVQRFVSLEGIVPVETDSLEIALHKPFVMPFYLPDDPPSAAVIHSLPIYRIEDQEGKVYHHTRSVFVDPVDEIKLNLEHLWSRRESKPFEEITPEDQHRLSGAGFIRRYTAFAVTYYSLAPRTLLGQYIDSQITDDAVRDPDFTAADVGILAGTTEIKYKYPQGFDLHDWAAKGKLYWLDLEIPDLPLKVSPVDQFPYNDIFDVTGRQESFTYHKGLFTWNGMRNDPRAK